MANNWGFGALEIKATFQNWINKTLQDTSKLYEKGLAEYANKNFNLAGGLFKKSAALRTEQFRIIEEDFQKLSLERRRLINETIRDLRLAGESYYEVKNYDSSLSVYKSALKFLKYAEDWDKLASTLNRVATCYYYQSFKSKDNRKFQLLDSANYYLNIGLDLSLNKSLMNWEWKFKGNLATLVGERSLFSNGKNKPEELVNALKILEQQVENIKSERPKSKDRFLYKNNIGICYYLLFSFLDSLELAKKFLDSSLINFSTIIHDPSFKSTYRLEWAYANNNLALSIMTNAFQAQMIPYIYEQMAFKILAMKDLGNQNPYNEIAASNTNNLIEQLDSVNIMFVEAEKTFREETDTFELAVALNNIAFLRIHLLLYSPKHLSNGFIITTDSIINVANGLAIKDGFVQEEFNSSVNKALLTVIKYLSGNVDSKKEIAQTVEVLENLLSNKSILQVYSAYLKKALMINYLVLSLSNENTNRSQFYFNSVCSLNQEIINSFKDLSLHRELEKAKRLSILMGCENHNNNE